MIATVHEYCRRGQCDWTEHAKCRSEYLVRGVLDLKPPDEYAYDMCSNGQCPHVYGAQAPKATRLKHAGERCPNCGKHRYQTRNLQVDPVRRCDLALPHVLGILSLLHPVMHSVTSPESLLN